MIERFQQYIKQQKLCNNDNHILLAISGGVDSVVMLDLFIRAKYRISIAHCNFQLRGNESERDEQFVKKLGEDQKVKVYTKQFDTKAYAHENKVSIQVAARELRYVWFEELIQKEGLNYVAVAQHADDQAETFFINLLRGSGLSGLRGMPVKRDNIIRPLLFAKRDDIESYAHERNLLFREDSSNKEDTYLRNKIRLKLIPELEKVGTKATDAVRESIQHLNDADILLKQLLNEKLLSVSRKENGIYRLSLDGIIELKPHKIWMYYLLRNFDFNRDITNNISEAITGKQSGKTFYSTTHKAVVDRNAIFIEQIKVHNTKEYEIDTDQEVITEPLYLTIKKSINKKTFKIKHDLNMGQLDLDKLSFPLKIRKWKKGDRFHPIGMKGSKLISDFFIDKKINLLEKQNIWLLVSGDDIVWIIGYRISEKYKITNETINMLSISLEKN